MGVLRVTVLSHNRSTPLHYAATANAATTCATLVRAGADASAADGSGQRPSDLSRTALVRTAIATAVQESLAAAGGHPVPDAGPTDYYGTHE